MLLNNIQEAASRNPGAVAVQLKEPAGFRTYTYRELLSATASVAQGFSLAGIAKGDRIAILSENRPEWIISYLAALSLGAVAVPLDAQLTEKEVAVLLASAEPKVICLSAATRSKLPPAMTAAVVAFDAGEGVSFARLMTAHPGAALGPEPAPGDPAAILYTSGTTGDPKGVVLTQGNLASNCESIRALNLFDSGDNMLCLLPLHHSYPAMGCMILPLSLGASVTMLNSLKGPDIVSTIREAGVTVVIGVPQLFTALRRAVFDEIGKKPLPLRMLVKMLLGLNGMLRRYGGVNAGGTLFGKVHAAFGPQFRLFASGGARLEPDVYADMTKLGFTIIEGYGLTETSPLCTFNPLNRGKAGSIGVPVPGVEVRIDRPDGQGMGELAVRGPNVMQGYYRKPEATAEVLRDGWFFTGDLGFRDRDGYFFITGRSKEMIVLATGKKIFPDELEKFYLQLPSIKEICIVPTERGIEAAVVPDFAYLKKMSIANARETIAFEIEDLQKDQPAYKRIMGIKIFKESLPATRLGKLRRPKVAELYRTGGERAEKTADDDSAALLETPTGRKVAAAVRHFAPHKPLAVDDNIEIDLGLDSLARVELVVSLEKAFGAALPESFGSEVHTVRDIILKLEGLLAGGAAASPVHVRMSWSEILAQELAPGAAGALRLQAGRVCSLARRLLHLVIKAEMLLCGRITVRGAGLLPRQGPYIIAPNHLSVADAPAVMAAAPWHAASQTFFLGTTDFFGGRVSSWIARLLQVIPVNMEARLTSAMQLSAHVLRSGKILLVFPEGSRSRDGGLKEFKKGIGIISRELNVPIVPAAITGTYELLPAGTWIPRPTRVSVTFGEPIQPGERKPEEISALLRERIAELLAVRKHP